MAPPEKLAETIMTCVGAAVKRVRALQDGFLDALVMNAVERVQQFTDKDYVPQERPRKSGLPPTNWPQHGRIELNSNWWGTWGEIAVQDLTCIELCVCTL